MAKKPITKRKILNAIEDFSKFKQRGEILSENKLKKIEKDLIEIEQAAYKKMKDIHYLILHLKAVREVNQQ